MAGCDWVTRQWLQLHPSPPRDPWRAVRALHRKGILIKVKKGAYRYNASACQSLELEGFSAEQRQAIFKCDNYRWLICGRGPEDGYEIHADHIVPKHLGGKAETVNGQPLCSIRNLRKNSYGQTDRGDRMFIRLHELAKARGHARMVDFCTEILDTFKRHAVNDHIEWNP